MLTRRAFLAAPALTLESADRRLREAELALPDGAVFRMPRRRARLLAVLRFRSLIASAVAFAADDEAATQDLLALIGPGARLLALERLRWQDREGAALDTRLAMLPDRTHLTLLRTAARKNAAPGKGLWQRESWTDYLRADADTLADAPPRPVLAGTWQSRLSAERRELAALCQGVSHTIPPTLLTKLAVSPLA